MWLLLPRSNQSKCLESAVEVSRPVCIVTLISALIVFQIAASMCVCVGEVLYLATPLLRANVHGFCESNTRGHPDETRNKNNSK